ncbi:MAG: hypothetical protein ACK5JH_06680 [Anaerocolumna sp.]
MHTMIKALQSIIYYPFILVLFILPVFSDLSLPTITQYSKSKGSGQLNSSVLSYIYYLPNKSLEEALATKYNIKSGHTKPYQLQRFYINNLFGWSLTPSRLNYLFFFFIMILVGYIQGISEISIPLGGHAPPKIKYMY